MIFSIGEPVRFAGNNLRTSLLRLALFCIAVLAGAGAFAALLGTLGQLLLPTTTSFSAWMVLFVVALLVMVREGIASHVPIPERRWQLPRHWLRSFWRSAAIFGTAMGVGIFTLTPSAIFYIYLLGCFLLANWLQALLVGVWYGSWFAGGIIHATIRWSDGEPGSQSGRALGVLHRARLLGLPAVPVILAFPGIWPFA